jgi:preprotein translocase subunit SecG
LGESSIESIDTLVCYNQQACKRFFAPARKWWNWQTHHLEGVAPKGVGVQIPPSAPSHSFIGEKEQQYLGIRMVILITIVHIIVCFFLIIVVLLQSGKSGDIAAAFGGMGSQTAFGPRGAATALSRATTWSAVIFMVTSITLSIFVSRRTGPNSVLQGITPSQTKSQPATPAKPPAPAQPK